ncbi:MAG: hypothetical protein IJV85_01255 [Clostridia bacterium]|nr:hypothetical protein [Clostridia bacterium]
MTLNEILSKNITNGRFFAIEAETEKKRKGITYRKRTTLTAQFGVNYANVASVKDRIAEQGGTLPTWFEHTEHASIVKSKKDETKLYLQIMNPCNIKTAFFLADGTPTTKAELVEMGAIREDEKSEKPVTLCYALENIIAITYREQAAA